ncbi:MULTISPECIES: NUDIX domain-containing protein [Calothrix]|uniref:NUDIX domain-containing protein n=2 Tax=Calothrix TaxID=1186 RepID=A0ABR8A8W1_9CYAN|nr:MULTISPECIES: NUDIX domain-containing protein [Calothrix]MBD2195202.1 NUDIX domain-containing protein [Calothrix parietina FACHB-288]MBD2223827.1 NUDIX domain-containing protein [Calothrix anomala FACHB-343]
MITNIPIPEPVSNQTEPARLPVVTVAALVKDSNSDRVLIAKTTKWRGLWGIPGGKVEWGESLEAALIREFREEVGLDITNIRWALLQESRLDPQFCKEAHFIMLNYYAESAVVNIIPNEEIVEWEWVSPQAALNYPLNSYTQILIENYLQQINGEP